MKRIASFEVDHDLLTPGMYTSRVDGDITTYDVRMVLPNGGEYLYPAAAHTFEHLFATYVRNTPLSDHVVYVGPMGCLTGFYFIVQTVHEIQPREVAQLIRDAYRYQANYKGEVPGATAVNCGNFRLHDLAMAKWEAKAFLKRPWKFAYPKARRIVAGGKTFFDA